MAAALASPRARLFPIEDVRGIAAAAVGLLSVRLIFLFLTIPSVGWRSHAASTIGFAIVSNLGAIASRRWSLRDIALVAGLFVVASGIQYITIFTSEAIGWGQNVICCLALTVSVILATIAGWRHLPEKLPLLSVSGLALWASTTQLCYLLLSSSSIGLKYNAAISASWTVFAVTLLVLGFKIHLRELRLMSFFVLATTVGKVFLVDLAALDSGIRVAVLLFLGLAMIGGGYWYIRTQRPDGAHP